MPRAVTFGDALAASDNPKSASRLKRDTGRVSGKRDALQRPNAMIFGRVNERF
jgi:hypothetical protein